MPKHTRVLGRRLLIILLVLILMPAAIAAAWVGTETMIEQTSEAEFCTSCHTMEPLARAHTRDLHGGDNPGGVVAECTDCHRHVGHEGLRNALQAHFDEVARDADEVARHTDEDRT